MYYSHLSFRSMLWKIASCKVAYTQLQTKSIIKACIIRIVSQISNIPAKNSIGKILQQAKRTLQVMLIIETDFSPYVLLPEFIKITAEWWNSRTFPDFLKILTKFPDLPVLENGLFFFPDFPGFLRTVGTLLKKRNVRL